MANRIAGNFALKTKAIWNNGSQIHCNDDGLISIGARPSLTRDGRRYGYTAPEENAMVRAKRLGGVVVRPYKIEGYIDEPGDIPASLIRFPDGSEYVVFDDGSGCQAPGRRSG